jgi:CDGSH-type Zn-finger protein/uncharacterized Fe-S cluster protein YjdI
LCSANDAKSSELIDKLCVRTNLDLPMPGEDAPIVIATREELIYLLTEAAEIEHGLMCCYLFAAYSLRVNDETLDAETRAMLGRWRDVIVDIAKEEMTHLVLVSNLLSAIGSAPHLARPNFPVARGYHPAGIIVSLAPFDRATLDHFIYLERPEGVAMADGAGFAPFTYRRGLRDGRLVPSAQDYETVGHLYRGIRDGFVRLSESLGEPNLFVGDPSVQVGADQFPMRGLAKVRNLEDAKAAIETIVEQGEGSPRESATSHYCRFAKVRDEYAAKLAASPDFVAARPVARNPVMRHPPDPTNLVWVDAEPAATLLDLGNAAYALMLRSLGGVFAPISLDPEVKATVTELALLAMRIMAPIAEHLTTLPASKDVPGVTAGLTFTMSRSIAPPADRHALRVVAELARALASGILQHVIVAKERVETAAKSLRRLADVLEACSMRAAPAVAIAPSKPRAPLPAAETARTDGVQEIRGKSLSILYEGKRCIHSRHCVLEAPKSFLANTPGEWILPDATDVETLVTVAHECVSGAIRYRRHDGGPEESAPPVNVATIRENGPLAFVADLHVDGQAPAIRAVLCRCGASKNKPFCDSSHHAINFVASGEPATLVTDPLDPRDGPLHVTPRKNGPNVVVGPLEICAGTGRTVSRVTRAVLCRCGASGNKPFCDGSHSKIGFHADGAE